MIRTFAWPAVSALAATMLLGCRAEIGGNHGEDAAVHEAVATLVAREEIRDLFADYGRMLDDRDFKAFAQLWTRDAEFSGGGAVGVAHGPDEIAAALERGITSNPSGVVGANLHVFSNEKIDVHGDTATATSRGAFIVANAEGRPEALIYATYRDELARDQGRWKFKRREIVGDIPGPPNGSPR